MVKMLRIAGVLIALGALLGPLSASEPSGNEHSTAEAPGRSIREEKPAILEVRRSRRAKVVFSEGRRRAWFEDAELGWGKLTLTVGEAHIDTAEGIAELSAGVTLTGPDFTVTSERCVADSHGAELSFPGTLEARSAKEGLALRAGQGQFYYLPDTGQPYKAVLAGGVEVNWESGASIEAPRMVYRFEPRMLELTEGFQGKLKGALVMPARQELAEQTVQLRGKTLFAQLRGPQEAPESITLTGSEVSAETESVQFSGPTLAARVDLPAGGKPGDRMELACLAVSGSVTAPVTGSWPREDGKRVHFSAIKVEKPTSDPALNLEGAVHLSSDEFDLSASAIELRGEDGQLRVEIPERFRMDFRREFIEALTEAPSAQRES